jgi:hypothetical protein
MVTEMTNRASSAGSGYAGGGGAVPTIRPDPDPTILTTNQLLREIANLETRFMERIESIEKSIEVAHQDLVRVPTDVDKSVDGLAQLVWERFKTLNAVIGGIEKTRLEQFSNIQTQFVERDTRTGQAAKASAEALAAALQAAKEAVGTQQLSNITAIQKQETTTKEQIISLGNLITQMTVNIDDRISDLKGRMDKLQGSGSGRQDVVAWIIAGFSLLANILLISRTFK